MWEEALCVARDAGPLESNDRQSGAARCHASRLANPSAGRNATGWPPVRSVAAECCEAASVPKDVATYRRDRHG
jgi:hypothetical protein